MSNGKTQQERLEAIEDAARKNNQGRLKRLLKNFRDSLELGLFEADPEEANRVLKKIESERLQPTTMADIMEIRELVNSLAKGELEEEEDEFGELATSVIGGGEEVSENDIEKQLITDDFLWVIFEAEIDEGGRKEKVERVNNLGFDVKSVKQLQGIVQETLWDVFKKQVQEVFKGKIPADKALDSETVLKIIKSKKDLQKFKIVLEAALPKKKKTAPTPTPAKKPAKKPPRPSPSKKEKPVFGTKVIPREKMVELREEAAGGPTTTTIPEGDLDKLVEQTTPKKPIPEAQDEEKKPAKAVPEKQPTLENLDNEIQKNPKLEFIIHALTGDIKAMKAEGIHITKKQLFDFLIAEDMVDAFQDFAKDRKSALQIMLDQKESDPYAPEELDGFCAELKARIKKYSEEKKKEGFPVPAPAFLSPPKEKGAVGTQDLASKKEPEEEGIQKIDDTKIISELQKPPKKPKTKKTEGEDHYPRKEKKPKKEDPDKILERLAKKDALKEFEEWSDLFRLLHFGKLPRNDKFKKQIISKRKRILGTETANDYNQLRMKLRKGGLRKFIDAKNPIDALRTRLVPKELEGKKLSEKLREKIDEIMEIIKKAKEETVVQKKKVSPKKPAKGAEPVEPVEPAEKAFEDIRRSVDAITDKKERGTLLQKLEKYLKSTEQEEAVISAPAKEIKAPDIESLAAMVEKNDILQPLIDDLEEIRKLLAKKEKLMKIGLTPKGFKDLESFGNKAKELEDNNDPLVRASSRQELVKEYLKISIKGNPSLLKSWDDKKSPKELAEILQNSWANFLDKLKK